MSENTKPNVGAEGAAEDAKAKFRAALEAKKARRRASAQEHHGGGGAGGQAHGAAGGQKMFRRKSG